MLLWGIEDGQENVFEKLTFFLLGGWEGGEGWTDCREVEENLFFLLHLLILEIFPFFSSLLRLWVSLGGY